MVQKKSLQGNLLLLKWYWQVLPFLLTSAANCTIMKKIILFVLIFVSSYSFSQKCSDYYFLQDKKTIEMTITNKKGKEVGKLIYNISNLKKTGNGTAATVNSDFFDKNGKSISKAVNTVQCDNGNLMMDMKMFIPSAQQQQMGDISATGTASYLEYPGNMKEGDPLKDASFSMDFKSTAGMNGRVTIDMTNRKVAGNESVTTPAGTWNCYKITYHSKMNFKLLIGFNMNSDVTEWYAPGFGVVRTVSENGTTEITAIK